MAEYDALPEIGHACGHNLIAESAVGAAIAVMEAMKTTDTIRGKLVVMGTPAEENCGGIFVEAGTSCNVIPESSKLIYNIRGETARDLDELVAKVEDCFQAAALATGCTVTMENDILYKDFVHNTVLSKIYRKHGRRMGVRFEDDDMVKVHGTGASSDAGNVSHELPTLHPVFLIPASSGNHTRAFAEAANSPDAQPPTLRAAKLLALTALDVLADPALLADVQREFREWKSSCA
ncbi:hypothetical protein HPB52_008964 [Rhipicephalus sanguineus]|uniref:Peptidase M20 dimerisation domain-containing protein n=1 Tax=Rhipicephalus sanguineus TaxID=34632 RepID=A0A9D4T904_RHISA|nr:hypothetical protein HPB52_008964 [Rhipicephalus sanguineus]